MRQGGKFRFFAEKVLLLFGCVRLFVSYFAYKCKRFLLSTRDAHSTMHLIVFPGTPLGLKVFNNVCCMT